MSPPFRKIPLSNLFVFEFGLCAPLPSSPPPPLATMMSTHRGLTCLGILMVGWFGLQDDPVRPSVRPRRQFVQKQLFGGKHKKEDLLAQARRQRQ